MERCFLLPTKMLYTITMNIRLKICILPLLVFMASCHPQTQSKSSSLDYGIMERQSISWAECLSQQEDHYLVFFHSETCSSCQEIKGDVISFASENICKTYFLDIDKPGNEISKCSVDEIVVGVDNINDFKIAGTPTIVEVQSGVTTANAPGKNKCLELLTSLRNNRVS